MDDMKIGEAIAYGLISELKAPPGYRLYIAKPHTTHAIRLGTKHLESWCVVALRQCGKNKNTCYWRCVLCEHVWAIGYKAPYTCFEYADPFLIQHIQHHLNKLNDEHYIDELCRIGDQCESFDDYQSR